MPRSVGRPPKPVKDRAKNSGFVAYPREIEAIKNVAKDLGFHSGFDYLRSRVIAHDQRLARGKIMTPRRV